MSRYQFRTARESDGELLNRFEETHGSGGSIPLTLSRTPHYFRAFEVEGYKTDVVIVLDQNTEAIVATAARSERECFINGNLANIGYLSSLRIAPEHRRGAVLARGYQFLRTLHENGSTSAYLCSVLESNIEALELLSSGRGPLPACRSLGVYRSCVIAPKRGDLFLPPGIRRMCPDDYAEVAEFLCRHGGTQRNFYPHYTAHDLKGNEGPLRGLDLKRVFIAERFNSIVGVVGIWDQTDFRRWRILSEITGIPSKRASSTSRISFLALNCITRDNLEVFHDLLETALSSCSEDEIIVAGFHHTDPLLPIVESQATLSIDGVLLICYWPDGKTFVDNIRLGIPYLEAGSL
jgi:hypothetical protein